MESNAASARDFAVETAYHPGTLTRTFLMADEVAEQLLKGWSPPVQLRAVQMPSGRIEIEVRDAV